MAHGKQLERFGIFTREDFLPPSLCEQLCKDIDDAPLENGDIWAPESGFHVEEEVKRRKEFSYSADTKPDLHRRLFDISAELAKVFGFQFTSVQPLKMTRYDVGDFYRPHRDIADAQDAPDVIRARKLALTLFLNQQGDYPDEGDYCGGSLTFYGLINDPAWQAVGMPLDSERGMIVAFRPDVIHEVTPVTHGTRYAITTWFA